MDQASADIKANAVYEGVRVFYHTALYILTNFSRNAN